MTSITFRPDDSGLQSLKKDNASTPPNRETVAVQASAGIPSINEQPATAPQTPALPVFSGPERRKGERRQGQQRVILDTRDHRERRRQPQPETSAGTDQPRIGIDIYS